MVEINQISCESVNYEHPTACGEDVMRHASPDTLTTLLPLLEILRRVGSLVERKPGIFYRGGKAFLHFHEDPSGLFADVKLDGASFTRWPVNTSTEQAALLDRLQRALGSALS